jgi:hypothetical protein
MTIRKEKRGYVMRAINEHQSIEDFAFLRKGFLE